MQRERLNQIKHDLRDIQKEQFRQFLIENGIAEQCELDDYTYSRRPSIVGIFKYNGQYFVYSTDGESEYHNIQRYIRRIDAFQDVASRFGLHYGQLNGLKR